MRPRRGSISRTLAAGQAISGTTRPATAEAVPDYREDGGSLGGVTGAHENRREYGAAVLKARCWCQRAIVEVPTELIKRAETLSCGHVRCTKENR